MLVAQIIEEIKTFPTPELESIETSLRVERLRRAKQMAPAEEMRLLQIINRPSPHPERFASLSLKWEEEGLSDEERIELLAINSEIETMSAERVEAVQRLSELRGIGFTILWKQLMGESPAPLVPRN